MSISLDYKGKVAIVTGAARGIGASTAKAFAEAGAKVVVTDLLPEVEDVAAQIVQEGGEAKALVADITKSANCKELTDLAMTGFGRLDFAFNNAGISCVPASPISDTSEEMWDRVIAINLSSVFNCIRFQIPAMLKGGGGVIVNNSSICGVRPFPGFSPYVASKHGVVGLTRSTAVEYAGQGIRCVAVGPGYVETPMTETAFSNEIKDGFIHRVPQGRYAKPEDIARAVRMLCSNDACYVNGAYLQVDGAMLQS